MTSSCSRRSPIPAPPRRFLLAALLALALALGGCGSEKAGTAAAPASIDVSVTFDFSIVPSSAVGMIQSIKLLPRKGGAIPVTVPTLAFAAGNAAAATTTVSVPEDSTVAWNAFAFAGTGASGQRFSTGTIVTLPGTLAVAVPMTLNYQPGAGLSSVIFCPDSTTGSASTCGGLLVVGGWVDVTISLSGLPGAQITITPATPANWTVIVPCPTLDPITGLGSAVLRWTPPGIGPLTDTLTVESNVGQPDYAVAQAYVTFIVGVAGQVAVTFQFGPVIVGMTAYNTGTPSGAGTDLALTVTTESAITSASAQLTQTAIGAPVTVTGLSGTTATLTVPGYDVTASGTLTVTVTDANNLSSTVTYTIDPGQYPAPAAF